MRYANPGISHLRRLGFLTVTSVMLVSGAGHFGPAAAQWQPDKIVEIIVPTSPGGGLDRFGRFIQKVITEKGFIPNTTSVVNKAGGGGLIGFNYLNQFGGDGHYLIVHTPTLLTNHILGKGAINHRNVTPLAELYSEYVVIMVRADSPLKNGSDLVNALKNDATSMSIGIATSLGNHNHSGVALPLKASGINIRNLKTVIFNSVGDSTAALLGGHIDIVPSPPGNMLALARSGKLRGIAISAPMRIGEPFANVPTWKELGSDVVFSTTRNVAGPRGLASDRILFWDNVFERMVDTREWKENLDEKLFSNTYTKSAKTASRLEEQYGELKEVLTELGLVKAKK